MNGPRRPSGAASKQTILTVVAVVLLAAAGYVLWQQVAGPSTPAKTLTLCCSECGRIVENQPAGDLPRTCPGCGKPTLRRAVQCYKCNHVFAEPPPPEGPAANPMEPVLPKCPKCGSADIGEPRS